MPLTVEHGLLATAIAKSTNKKIGDAAATYAAQTSCPRSCAFFNGGGCYAENGTLYSGITKPLNGAAELAHATRVDVAEAEADAIDQLDVAPGRPMRLHTVGDCATDETALIVSAAAERYMARGGGPVWTYTHAWAIVDRQSWGRVSVLASCETPEQVELARARGYATSIVVAEFEQRTKYVHSGAEIVPCPAQTHDDVACSSCRLCMDDVALRGRGYSIGFAVHGTAFTIKQAEKSLRAPGDDDRRLTSRDHALTFLDEHGRLPRAAELARICDINPASAKEMVNKLRHQLRTAA